MVESITYRKLRKYKYQLMEDYSHPTSLAPDADVRTKDDWIVLSSDGVLKLKKGYAWDGPSGPTIDTKNFMRGSLVHDALYQLLREGKLDADRWKENRKYADALLREVCRADGMSRFRARYVYWSVRAAGRWSAKTSVSSDPVRITAP